MLCMEPVREAVPKNFKNLSWCITQNFPAANFPPAPLPRRACSPGPRWRPPRRPICHNVQLSTRLTEQ